MYINDHVVFRGNCFFGLISKLNNHWCNISSVRFTEGDLNTFCFDTLEVTLSGKLLKLWEIQYYLDLMCSISYVTFDIDNDNLEWRSIFMYLMGKSRLIKIDFGRLIFQGAYVSFLSYIGTALELLIIHCFDNEYDNWLTDLFESVTVGKLVIDRFSIQTDTGIEEREFVIRSFGVPRIAV